MEFLKVFVILILSFGIYAIAFALNVIAFIYGWGLNPVSWTWVIIPAIATIVSAIVLQLIVEAIKS